MRRYLDCTIRRRLGFRADRVPQGNETDVVTEAQEPYIGEGETGASETMLEKAARELAAKWLARDQAAAEQGGRDIRLAIDSYLPQAREDVRAILSTIRNLDETIKEA